MNKEIFDAFSDINHALKIGEFHKFDIYLEESQIQVLIPGKGRLITKSEEFEKVNSQEGALTIAFCPDTSALLWWLAGFQTHSTLTKGKENGT